MHNVVNQLSIGPIIEVLPPATIGIKDEGLKQAEASGFEAMFVKASVQAVDNL